MLCLIVLLKIKVLLHKKNLLPILINLSVNSTLTFKKRVSLSG